jgi:8-oxo-dGTP diphosphatase
MTITQTTYCAGFLFDDSGRVALVRKNRPAWQAGRLNGVGGHVEKGETPAEAMRREFWEEAGLDLEGWEHFATVTFPAGEVWFYRLLVDIETLDQVETKTDEPIEIHSASGIAYLPTLPNLSWLVPLAAYRHDRYAPLIAAEVNAQ